MKKLILSVLSLLFVVAARAQEITYLEEHDINYNTVDDSYANERCKLDVYYPQGISDCPVVVWFHGGGLVGGNKFIPEQLKNQGIVVVAVNYRFLPKVTIDTCIKDAAAATAWVFNEIGRYGGSKSKVFLSGHSAGGYLVSMLCLDKTWLAEYGVDADSIAATVPFSAQVISHFNYRKMNGIDPLQPIIDQYAPLYHVRKDASPLILITGDSELEMYGRYEENAYLWRMMKLVGHPSTYIYKLDGYDHGGMAAPAFHILKQWINKVLGKKTYL